MNASKGLIVSAEGLHEDVSALRDVLLWRDRLFPWTRHCGWRSLLRVEVNGHGHPTEQAKCIEKFDRAPGVAD